MPFHEPPEPSVELAPDGGHRSAARDPHDTSGNAPNATARRGSLSEIERRYPAGVPRTETGGGQPTAGTAPSRDLLSLHGIRGGTERDQAVAGITAYAEAAAAAQRPMVGAEEGIDLLGRLAPEELRAAVEGMSSDDLARYLERARMRLDQHELGSERGDDQRALWAVRQELEWQLGERRRARPTGAAATRTMASAAASMGPAGAALPLLATAEHDEPRVQTDAERGDSKRPRTQRDLDALIARLGVRGARQYLEMQRSRAAWWPAESDPLAIPPEVAAELTAELAAREAEAKTFVSSFEQHGRGIALGLLAEGDARVKAELERYGFPIELRSGPMGPGPKPGADTTALDDAVRYGKLVQAAAERVTATQKQRDGIGGAGDQAAAQALQQFWSIKELALATHPVLHAFLSGESRNTGAPTSTWMPNVATIGTFPREMLGGLMSWELNQKLLDIRTSRQNIAGGTLSIFGVPKVVTLTKEQMHVAPGSMLDGVINEAVAENAHRGWTEELLASIAFALGLLLAVPTGGASAGVAAAVTAGQVAALATDLYLVGKEIDRHGALMSASNTDLSIAQALIQEEPSAAPIILGLFGAGISATGIASAGADFTEAVVRSRETIRAMRVVREGGAELGQAIETLRNSGRRAGIAEDEVEALTRTLQRDGRGVHPRAAAPEAAGENVSSAAAQEVGRPAISGRAITRGAPSGGGLANGIEAAEIVAINKRFGDGTMLTGDVSTVLANAARQDGFFNKAASMIRDIAGGHLFENGNKRTAHEAVVELMRRNNIVNGPTSGELYRIVGMVARGELRTVEDIASHLRGYR